MKNRYLSVKHYFVPAQNAKTEQKDFGKTGEKLVDERISFSNNVNKADLVESTFILDLKDIQVLKNRFKDSPDNVSTNEDVIKYYLKEYRKEITETHPYFRFDE